ncbi:Na+/H+ antiporter NhaC family protein [Candidatus Margulisiibacteriota bacterium]
MTNSSSKSIFSGIKSLIKSPAAWVFIVSFFLSIYVGKAIPPTWTVEKVTLDVTENVEGELFYRYKGKDVFISDPVPLEKSGLNKKAIIKINKEHINPGVKKEIAYETILLKSQPQKVYYKLVAKHHWKLWSMIPALVAILLCWITREPIAALSAGIITGAMILGHYDLADQVLLQSMMTKEAAGVLLLYLWLLGGLMGIWSRTGAAQAFAELITKHFVRGPRTAKLVAWMLGTFFFQGGSVSCVLVGTTVKPIADKERISHEELSYIVDANATSIATLLPFNAWPGYVQAFIYVAGVSWLATEADRIAFFFKSIPFYFYSIAAVVFTFLLAIEKLPFMEKFNPKMVRAMKRSRETGQLDEPGSEPLSAKELQASHVPEGYIPHVLEFFIPLGVLVATAITTFITMGSPQVRWAFGLAVAVALSMAILRGMKLKDLMEGLSDGFKGVILGSLILLLAVTIGDISKELGGGLYLVELLGAHIPYWLLPIMLTFLTMLIAFSTGTSWGTYAVSFPLALPLAWHVATSQAVGHPMLYMSICFATVINGSIFGDQCSPISDTCVLSAMVSGCDLMDHVITQLCQSVVSMLLAIIGWTAIVLIFV